MAAYDVYDYLKNAVVTELDNTEITPTNTFGQGTTDKVDEWLAESERAAYREEITRNPAFEFRSVQRLYADPDTDMNQSSNTFLYPENFLEFKRVVADPVEGEERITLVKTSPDLILNVPTDTMVELPSHFADVNRTLQVIPVSRDIDIVMYYYGSLDPISTVTSATRTENGVSVPNRHYLLNELGEWLKYDACVRGGAYFDVEQRQIDRWLALRDEAAMGVYRQARRAQSSGTTPRRNIPSKYTIRARQRRGYY